MSTPFGFLSDAQRLLRQIDPDAGRTIDNATRRVYDVRRDVREFMNPNPDEDPQRSYMWEVGMTNPLNDDNSNIRFYGVTTGIPAQNNEPIKRFYAGVPYTISGKDASPKTFRLTLWDNENLEIYRFMSRWIETMQQGRDYRKVSPSTYYRDITLSLRDNSDSYDTISFVFRNCFPSEISEVPLAYNESNAINIDVIFSYNTKETL